MTVFADQTPMDRSARPAGVGFLRAGRITPIQRVGLLLGVVYVAVGGLFLPFEISADGAEYFQMAQNLLNQHGFTFDGTNPVAGKPPGFPFLIAVYLRCFGSISGFQLVQLLLTLGSFLVLAEVIRRMADERWALGLLVLLIATIPFQYMAQYLWSEPGFFLLNSIGMLLLLLTTKNRNRLVPVGAGAALAAATYFRPVTLFWPVGVVVLSAFLIRASMRRVLVVLFVHVILIAPWIYRNWVEFKSFVPMVANWAPLYYMTEENTWKEYYFAGSVAVRGSAAHQAILDGQFEFNWAPSERFKSLAIDRIKKEPLSYLGRCTRQALFAWSLFPGTRQWYRERPLLFMCGRIVMLFFHLVTIVGAAAIWKRDRTVAVLLAGYAVYTAAMLFPVCTESRYLIPAYMWLLPLTVTGAIRILQRARIGLVRLNHS